MAVAGETALVVPSRPAGSSNASPRLWSEEQAFQVDIEAILSAIRSHSVTAVYSPSSILSAVMLRGLVRAGIGVPEDVSVLSGGAGLHVRHLYPGLTSLVYPMREMVEGVSRWVNGENVKQILGSCTFREGETVAEV